MVFASAFASASSRACVARHGTRLDPKGAGVNSVRPAFASQQRTAKGRFTTTPRVRSRSFAVASTDSGNVNVSVTEEPAVPVAPPSPVIAAVAAPATTAPAEAAQNAPVPAKATFQQRVDAAAAALRSGRASQTRRRVPTASPSADGAGATATGFVAQSPRKRNPAPSSRAFQNTRVGMDPPTNPNSLITKTNSESEMAASQRRLFEQMVTLRTRLNERLAASNKFAKFLEFTLRARDSDIKHANERLVAAMLEIESLKGIAQDAIDAAAIDALAATDRPEGGTSRDGTRNVVTARLDTLQRRLDLMSKALRKDVETIDAACIKNVPIRWVGMASDIRIMGSFDHWTKGVAMSPEHIEGGSNLFVAEMELIPGTYQIKFVVDGIWQTAQEWPTEGSGLDANNLLIVE